MKKRQNKDDKYAQNRLELQKIGVNIDSKDFKKKYDKFINKIVAAQTVEDLYGNSSVRHLVEIFVKNIDTGEKSPTKKEINTCIDVICKNFEENKEQFDNQNELLSISSELISFLIIGLLLAKVIFVMMKGGTAELDVMDFVDGLGFFGCLVLSLILFKIPKTPFWKKYLYLHSKNSAFKIVSGGVFSFGYLMFLMGWGSADKIYLFTMVGLMAFAVLITVLEPIYFYVFRFKWIKRLLKEDLKIEEKKEPVEDDRKCV